MQSGEKMICAGSPGLIQSVIEFQHPDGLPTSNNIIMKKASSSSSLLSPSSPVKMARTPVVAPSSVQSAARLSAASSVIRVVVASKVPRSVPALAPSVATCSARSATVANHIQSHEHGSQRWLPCFFEGRAVLRGVCVIGLGLFARRLDMLLRLLPALLLAISASAADLDFYQDVYPFLKANCISCHNKTTTKADLNMETPELMIKGGENGPSIVPGKSGESLIVAASLHTQDMEMPPPNNKTGAVNLTPAEIAILRQWIDQGAKKLDAAGARGRFEDVLSECRSDLRRGGDAGWPLRGLWTVE